MIKKYFIGVMVLVTALFFSSFFGCAKTKAIVNKIIPKSVAKKVRSTPNLKKRVMIIPIIEHAGLGEGGDELVTSTFLNFLTKSPRILIHESHEEGGSSSKKKLTGLGHVTPGLKLIKKAEDLGMHAIVTGIVNPIETNTKKSGIWPFRKYYKIYEVSVIINVMDVMSQTLMLTQLESEKESVPSNKIEMLNEKELIIEFAREVLPGILKRQASAVSKKLSEFPWTGKVLAVDDDTIKINAGVDVGLRPDVYFSVFARGDSISSGRGKVFGLLGEKIGEIKVISVENDHSLAIPTEGGPFSAGQIIKMGS